MVTNKQKGATLVIALVILIALTIIGLVSMQSSTTEVSMAGNLRNSATAFSAAEVGLADGESFVESQDSPALFDGNSNGLYPLGQFAVDVLTADWDGGDSRVSGVDLSGQGVAAPPRYMVRYVIVRYQNEAAAINVGGYGSSQPGQVVSYFQVFSKGYGLNDMVNRYVTSYYGKEF